MAKQSGLGVRLYASGYDLNTDVSALSGVGSSQELLDVTALENPARARIPGLGDASISVNGFFDNAAGRSHALYSSNSGALPTTDQNVVISMGTSRGDPACGFAAKQATYTIDRAPGNAVATSVSYEAADGYGLSWGVLLTDGPKQTDTSATNSASVDNGSSTAAGAVAVLEVETLTGTSATVVVQDSSDDAVWTDLLTFTAATDRTSEIVRVTGTSTVDRYLRVTTSGTFTVCTFVLTVARL